MQLVIRVHQSTAAAADLSKIKKGSYVAVKNDNNKWELATVLSAGSKSIKVDSHNTLYSVNTASADKWLRNVDVSHLTARELKKAYAAEYTLTELKQFKAPKVTAAKPVKTPKVEVPVKAPAARTIDLTEPSSLTKEYGDAVQSLSAAQKQGFKLFHTYFGKYPKFKAHEGRDPSLAGDNDYYRVEFEYKGELVTLDSHPRRQVIQIPTINKASRDSTLFAKVKALFKNAAHHTLTSPSYIDLSISQFGRQNHKAVFKALIDSLDLAADARNSSGVPTDSKSLEAIASELSSQYSNKRIGEVDLSVVLHNGELTLGWNLSFRRSTTTGAFQDHQNDIAQADTWLKSKAALYGKYKNVQLNAPFEPYTLARAMREDDYAESNGNSAYSEYEQVLANRITLRSTNR